MKKIKTLVLFMASFGLFSCGVDGPAGLGSYVNLTELPTPTIREVSNNYIYWDEVPNASSYVLKINDYQENVGNNLKYSISAMMDSRIESNVETLLHIYVKANGNHTFFSDSKWSNEFTYSYTKVDSSSELNMLDTPVFSYDCFNNLIEWKHVENADGYELKINGTSIILPRTINSTYSPEVQKNTIFTFSMRALAPNSGNYSNSNWSREISYKYLPEENSNEEIDSYCDKSVELGIGYGYNFIDDEYFDVNKASRNSIIDLKKLYKYADLRTQTSNFTKNKSIYSENITDFQLAISSSINSEVSASGVFDIFSANLSIGLKKSLSIDFSKYSNSGFLNCSYYQELKNYQVIEYGASSDLSTVLSDNFLKFVNKEDNYKDLTDVEIANYILNNFGTHLILGVKTGGRLDYYYSFATNDSKVAADFKSKLDVNGSADVIGLISGSSNNSLSTELKASLEKHETECQYDYNTYGGETTKNAENQNSDIGSICNNWMYSINESNARSMGVSKDGIIYLPSLINFINPELSKVLDSVIKSKANEAYNELIKNYKTNDGDIIYNDSETTKYIYNKDDFVNKISSDLSGNYLVMNDIDFENTTLVPFSKFNGTLKGYMRNGVSPTLKNFSLSSTNSQLLGLFSELSSSGVIANINVDNCNMKFNYDNKGNREGAFGVFAGLSSGTIENCTVSNSKFNGYIYYNAGTNQSVKLHNGAIVGWNNGGTINNCQSINNTFVGKTNIGKSDGTAECNIGGIAGMCTGQSLVNNSESSGIKIQITLRGGKTWTAINAKFNGRAGGIVGYNGKSASVINCKAKNNDLSNYVFKFEKAESCKYDNNTSKGVFIGKNDGNASSNITK